MNVKLDILPVGVKFLNEEGLKSCLKSGFKSEKIISFCDGVRKLKEDNIKGGLLITPNSISICKWCQIVLGLKKPKSYFEKTINIKLEFPIYGIFIFNINEPKRSLPDFNKTKNPDTVLIRTTPEKIKSIIEIIGWNNFTDEYFDKLDSSALSLFKDQASLFKVTVTKLVNNMLTKLNTNRIWKKLINVMFKSEVLTLIWDIFIKKFMADMSMCRNSTVIPFLKNKGNISFFCTGGIAWGNNSQQNMPMGLPFDLYMKLN